MIEVERLAKQFEARVEGKRARVVAVEDISFVAHDGRVTALLGPNGAGKTTTMRVVAGLVRADRGHARVGGVDVAAGRRPRAAAGGRGPRRQAGDPAADRLPDGHRPLARDQRHLGGPEGRRPDLAPLGPVG